jgi:hypothetical protein
VVQTNEDCVLLPIELTYFQGECHNNQVTLNWQTASERNNDFFTIDYSADGTSWEQIAHVSGSGTTSELSTYSFVDQRLLAGAGYYRLKQTDFDGKSETFDPIRVECAVANEINIFPNPSSGKFTVMGLEKGQFIHVVNTSGQLIYSTQVLSAIESIDLSAFSKGTYMMQLIGEHNVNWFKLIKQ